MKREMTIVPYDPAWKERFEALRCRLHELLEGTEISILHFGSTAIEGMWAKPIIDMMILVKDISIIDSYSAVLESQGFCPKGENGIPGRRYFKKLSPDGINHIAHVHCYEPDHPHVKNEMLFCRYLQEEASAFERYLAIKREAAKLYRFDPKAYSEHKTETINHLLAEAKRMQQSDSPENDSFRR